MIRHQVFKDEDSNLILKKWMKDNNITHFTFNDKLELVLYSKKHSPALRGSAWLDQTSLETKPGMNQHSFLTNSLFRKSSKNTINYFHLIPEFREQITYLRKARSKRFRTPLLMGATGFQPPLRWFYWDYY